MLRNNFVDRKDRIIPSTISILCIYFMNCEHSMYLYEQRFYFYFLLSSLIRIFNTDIEVAK
jgi:hypothetical protein